MFCNIALGEDGQSLLTIFSLLIPAAFYILGLQEGKRARLFFFIGLFFHAVSLVLRGVTVGTLPLTEKHDNISFMAFAMALAYWYFSKRKESAQFNLLALPLISVFLIIAILFQPINTISPYLRSPWFFLHMFLFTLSYGFFGISACLGLLYLFSKDNAYEAQQYQGAVQGWILLSLALVAGSIWFFVCYGTYWLWTSKELWATLTWFYYGWYLHARYLKGLSGKPAAILGIIGFAVALFSYFGVGTIIPAPPTTF